MADTGAPWNIPYIEPSDLVRDYPAADEAQANAIADGLTAAGNAGIGSNVVQGTQGTALATSSTSFVDTNLTATITPTTATSKVLVIVSQPSSVSRSANNVSAALRLMRDATDLGMRGEIFAQGDSGDEGGGSIMTFAYLDSPATTSATTYKTEGRLTSPSSFSAIARFNSDRSGNDVESTIMLIEVAA